MHFLFTLKLTTQEIFRDLPDERCTILMSRQIETKSHRVLALARGIQNNKIHLKRATGLKIILAVEKAFSTEIYVGLYALGLFGNNIL